MPHNAGMPSPLLLPLLTCAAVLLVSGVAKLRDPASVDRAFTALEVPTVLDRSPVRRALPWAEAVLGLWLLVTGGALLLLGAVLVLVLFLAYLVLVARAVRRPEPVDCGCFGALGDDRVTRVTVWRNVVLVAAAGLAVVAGQRDVALVPALSEPATWAWLGAAALATLAAVLVTHRSPGSADVTGGSEPEVDEDGNYLRTAIPRAQVLTEEGRVALLRDQTNRGAHLLLFLSPGCTPCQSLSHEVAGWADDLAPLVVVKAVVAGSPESLVVGLGHLKGHAWFDEFGIARAAFAMSTPGAVLLGTDGYLAGGPVHGEGEVRAFVEDVREHLRAQTDVTAP